MTDPLACFRQPLTGSLDPMQFSSLAQFFSESAKLHGDKLAFTALGHSISYRQLDELSDNFAAYLQQKTKLQVGDRIAIQLPNILQFPIAAIGAVKAGLTLVNTNPLYTSREMKHQFQDADVKAIVILENFGDKLEHIIGDTAIETVITTELGDALPAVKRYAINFALRYIKKMVPKFKITGAVQWQSVLSASTQAAQLVSDIPRDETAVILYTGGTTGLAKGAMLTHANLLANMFQLRAVSMGIIHDGTDTLIAPLPLYHSYAFMLHMLTMFYAGNHNVLVPNPRDIDSLISVMRTTRPNGIVGINTLYLALCRHKDIRKVDFSHLRFSGAGGMALTPSVAKEWGEITQCEVFEGYGLTECSPIVTLNPVGAVRLGTVGVAVPETELKVIDDDGKDVTGSESGELLIRGPQVMKGYWNNDEATANSIDSEGWLKTGDCALIDDEGYVKIVDRKKDMIIVSGFNVFPSEIEELVNSMPEVSESAVIGIPNEDSGELVKLFVVAKNPSLDVSSIKAFCKENLTAYKVPKQIVIVDDLPKSNIGKILRRELREQELAKT
ncbi:MAG: AMP-binding protein [Pseudohongiellaceae bacterium]|nr:AMP-binding protein [Pseudohongiellaceae bacterium]